MFIDQHERDAKKSNMVISRKMCEEIIRNAFSNINLRLRNEGYTPSNMEELETDVEDFTKSYDRQAVGPAKLEVYMEFMKTAIPKISKDVLSKEYMKQKENEDRLNQAVKILQEKNKMLEDNLKDVEDEFGNKQNILEELEIKLRKATKQEEMLLNKAEEEAGKRRALMEDLQQEKVKNDELEQKRKKAERDIKAKEEALEREARDLKRKQALGANLSKEEEARLKELSRQGGRAKRTGQGVDLSEIEIENRSDQGSTRQPQETKESKKDKKNKNKSKVGSTDKGKANCKCVIF